MYEQLLSLIVATGLLLGSPGPAPLALAATGATYGVKNSIPFLLGILLGLSVAIVGAALGVVALFTSFPGLKLALQILGAIYIGYVALKIARAPVLSSESAGAPPPLRLVDGFILNLLNPKAYAAFLALFTQFLLPAEEQVTAYLYTGVVCFLVAFVVDVLWLTLGGVLRPMFEQPRSARTLRLVFAVLMVMAVVWAMTKS